MHICRICNGEYNINFKNKNFILAFLSRWSALCIYAEPVMVSIT